MPSWCDAVSLILDNADFKEVKEVIPRLGTVGQSVLLAL
jgi:hypothetical protein